MTDYQDTNKVIYTPPKTVREFMLSKAKTRIIKGPFGSGKSVGCIMNIARLSKEAPICRGGKRLSKWVVVRNTAQQLKDTTISSWFEWLPPGVAGTWKEGERKFIMEFGDVKSEVLFRPLDTPDDVSRVLSLEVSGAWVNECREVPKEIIEGLQGRIGRYHPDKNVPRGNFGLMGDTNPPEEDSWWWEMLEKIIPNKWDVFHQPSGLSPEAENIEHLPPDYYEDMCDGKGQVFIDQYVHGKYAPSLAGKAVYADSFDPDVHISKEPLLVVENKPIIVGMDFGRTPACTFNQYDHMGRFRTLSELVSFDMGLKKFTTTMMMPHVSEHYAGLDLVVWGDPSGVSKSSLGEQNSFGFLKSKGFDAHPAPSQDPTIRIDAIEHFLMARDGYMIDLRCKWMIQGFKSRYMYVLNRKGVAAVKPDKNDWSHVMEGTQYGALGASVGLSRSRRQRQFAAQNTGSVWRPADSSMGY